MTQPFSSSPVALPLLRTRTLKGMVLGLTLGIAAVAFSLPAVAGGYGHGHGGHHMMGGGMGGPKHLDRMLRDVDASEQQRSQIRQIMQSAAADLKAQHETGRQLREQMRAQLTQPNVDAAAVEALRQQAIAHADVVSRRMTQAMVDAARVLTPEQRAKLGEQMAERQRRFEQRMQEREQRRAEQPRQ